MPDAAVFQGQFARAIAASAPPEGAPSAFAVYRNTWLKGLLDALGANYPTVMMILGTDLFEAVALQFAHERPARSAVLALYGSGFADFLACHQLGRDIPYLRDVAALERLWTEAFFAAETTELKPSRVALLRPAEMLELRLPLHPATRFARFETPATTIWQAHRAKGELGELEPDWRAEHALVTRREMSVAVNLIDEATHRLLREIQGGHTIGEAIAATAKANPSYDLGAALAIVIANNALCTPQAEDMRIW